MDGLHGEEMSGNMCEYLKKVRNRMRRGFSFLLVLCMIASGIHFPIRAEEKYENYLDGWKVACAWSTLSKDYIWDAERSEQRQPKLVVTYRLENASHDCAPGDVWFEIPGIGGVNRASILKASELASDASDSEWMCVWDQEADIYTFSNRFSIEEGQSISGGFQLLWTLPARNMEHGYCQERTPAFGVNGAGRIVMEPVSFAFSSLRDRYRISLDSSRLSAKDLEKADQDYIWYEAETRFDKDWLARGLYRSSYYIAVELPDGKNYSDVRIKRNGVPVTLEEIVTEDGDTVWGFYPFKNRSGDIGTALSTYYDRFQIGFLRDHFKEETGETCEVTMHGHLDRLYCDESVWVTEAGSNEQIDDSVSFAVEDYSFQYSGYVYTHRKWNSSYENTATHAAPSSYSKRLNAVNLYNGTTISFTVQGTAERNYTSTAAKTRMRIPGEVEALAASASNAVDLSAFPVASASNALMLKAMASALNGGSQIGMNGNSDLYSLRLGDDKLAVFLTDGTIRKLEDSEYEITYVTVPSDSGRYDYEVYGAETQDASRSDYECLGDGNTAEEKTIQLPEGIRSVWVQVNGITGSYSCSVRIGVRLNLDWAAEQEKAEAGEPVPDHNNRLINFSYLQSLYEDGEGNEKNDCAVASGNYEGGYGQELAERDMAVYGEYLLRSYSNVWLRSPITKLSAVASFPALQESGQGSFISSVTSAGTIQADDSGPLRKFSIYTVIPDGVEPDVSPEALRLSGKGEWYSGEDEVVDFENHVSYSLGEYRGKWMLAADFDFSDSPLEISGETRVAVSFPVTLTYSNFISLGRRYIAETYLMVHDDGLDQISGTAIMADAYDINQNGNTIEKAAYSTSYSEAVDSASEWREYVSKYIRSDYSEGYETETVVRLSDPDPEFDGKSRYAYRLDFGLGSNHAKNIDLFDRIEQGARIAQNQEKPDEYTEIPSAWQGEFVAVNTSYAEKMKLKPTVSYSTDPDQELSADADGWSTEPPENPETVRSVWIHLDTSGMEDGMMKTRQMTYVEIQMRAPEDRSLVGQKAVNQYYVQFDAYGIGSADSFESRYELPSSETYVKLMDNVAQIILQKVDGDHQKEASEDGSAAYAALTGALFQVYDPEGNPMLGENGKRLNALGQIVLSNVRYGTYRWEELSAPEGYEKITGRHNFEVDREQILLEIPNRRIPGEVILTKYDRDSEEATLLAGAEFELFRENGDQVFWDRNSMYSEMGTESRAVTGTDGTLKITGLPWGSYRFVEVRAPKGYELDETPIPFTIGKNQFVSGDETAEDRVIAFVSAYNKEQPVSLMLKKQDAEDGSAVRDAIFSLYRKSESGDADSLIQSGLRTNAAGELQVDGLLFGDYYFIETRNPAGYQMPLGEAARTEIVTLGPSCTEGTAELCFVNERMRGEVLLLKRDDAGQPVPGAVYTLMYRARDQEEYTLLEGAYTTNSEGEIRVSKLAWGEYCFIEQKAPKGYEISKERVEFTVNQSTAQSTIYVNAVNERQKGSVRLTKIDGENKGRVLAGAEYELYRIDGTKCIAGIDYSLPAGTERIVTGNDGTILISELTQGGYYLQELTAPESYSLSNEKIRFSVTRENANVIQELEAEDIRSRAVLRINKRINEAYAPFGKPVFIFRIQKTDPETGDAVQTCYQTITLEEGQCEGSVMCSVERGYFYEITEMSVPRYKLEEVIPNSPGIVTEEDCAEADLRNYDYGEVTFRNHISQYEKLSHTASVINIVKAGAKLTGISVDYHGPEPINENTAGYDGEERSYTIPDSDLTVSALYDDGTSRQIPKESYTFLNPVADGSSNSYTGTVVYREEGIERTGTFSVNVALPRPWNYYQVVMELGGGTIVRDEDETMTAVETWERRVREGSTILKPKNWPVREDSGFCGWYADPECKILYDFSAPIEADTHIYAKWSGNYDVKYAVCIYAINNKDADGAVMPLTFGPATSFSCIDTYVSHTPAPGELCIHDLTWEEIIAQARKNPYVFSSCLKNGCTQSVWLFMHDENQSPKAIAGEVYSRKMDGGDGTSVLVGSINEFYRVWNHSNSTYYDEADPRYEHGGSTGGWPDSAIRNTLNGVVTEGMLTITNKDNGFEEAMLSEDDALISCFPDSLQEAIYPKAIKSDTVYDDKVAANVKITRDKLWLFSPQEYFSEPNRQLFVSHRHPLEGVPFQRQTALNIANWKPEAYLYAENGEYLDGSWFRSLSTNSDGSVILMKEYCSNTWSGRACGLSPCFCIR